jgi:SAM-dependent methyltransferase
MGLYRMKLRGQALLDALLALPFAERDLWVDELLSVPGIPADLPNLPSGTVPYLPCEVDAIVRAVREAPVKASDVFVDLGAGVGRPALLAHLLTGARAVGVELQPHLVDHARRSASGLDVSFVQGDASIQIPDGTIYFIYASFNGAALTRVLERMRQIAARHPIVVCAVDFEVDEEWLVPRPTQARDLVLYDSQ